MVEEVEDNNKQINSQKHTKIAPTRQSAQSRRVYFIIQIKLIHMFYIKATNTDKDVLQETSTNVGYR